MPKVELLVFLLSVKKQNLQGQTINAGETSRPKDTVFQEKNVPEVCFSSINCILAAPF